MGDGQPPVIAPKAARAGLKLLLGRARGGARGNGCVWIEALHLALEQPGDMRVVLGEGREVKPDGWAKLKEGQRKRAQEETCPGK